MFNSSSEMASSGRIDAIGRAPKVGRPRWQALADLLKTSAALKAAKAVIKTPGFAAQDSDVRFLSVFSVATEKPKEASKSEPRTVTTASGRRVAQVTKSGRDLKIVLDKKFDAEFADFLVGHLAEQLPIFAEQFAKAREEGTS